jgi:hypothetical protein
MTLRKQLHRLQSVIIQIGELVEESLRAGGEPFTKPEPLSAALLSKFPE